MVGVVQLNLAYCAQDYHFCSVFFGESTSPVNLQMIITVKSANSDVLVHSILYNFLTSLKSDPLLVCCNCLFSVWSWLIRTGVVVPVANTQFLWRLSLSHIG